MDSKELNHIDLEGSSFSDFAQAIVRRLMKEFLMEEVLKPTSQTKSTSQATTPFKVSDLFKNQEETVNNPDSKLENEVVEEKLEATLKDQLAHKEASIQTLTSEMNKLQLQKSQWENEINSLRSKNAELLVENNELKARLQKLKDLIN